MKYVGLSLLCALLCVTLAQDATAEADLGFKGAGGRLSLVFPDNIDTAIGFGGLVELGTITPDVTLGATLDLWFSSESTVDIRDIIFAANSKYHFTVKNKKLKPYAGGGLAIHIVNVDVPSTTVGTITVPGASDSDVKIGLDLLGGLGYEVSPKVDITGELMYRIVSDVSQLVISGGIIYWFGK